MCTNILIQLLLQLGNIALQFLTVLVIDIHILLSPQQIALQTCHTTNKQDEGRETQRVMV